MRNYLGNLFNFLNSEVSITRRPWTRRSVHKSFSATPVNPHGIRNLPYFYEIPYSPYSGLDNNITYYNFQFNMDSDAPLLIVQSDLIRDLRLCKESTVILSPH